MFKKQELKSYLKKQRLIYAILKSRQDLSNKIDDLIALQQHKKPQYSKKQSTGVTH